MSKNAISTLQEFCAQTKQNTPIYNILENSNKTFTCIVQANSNAVSADGLSKKEAKLHAAYKMLTHILQDNPSATTAGPATNGQIATARHCVDGPRSAISQLQEMCAKYKLPPPMYEDEAKSGTDHQPMFTVKCMCSNQCTRGTGTTKKIAKENAAGQILVALNGQQLPTPTKMPLNNINAEQVAPLNDSHTINARGRLQEMCFNRKVSQPEFSDAVVSNAGNFTVTCRLQSYTKTGTGRSKKAAIQDAASQMFDMLEYRFETEICFNIRCEEIDFPAPEDIIKVYRQHRQITRPFDGEVMLNDRHSYFQRLSDTVRSQIRRVIDSNVEAAQKVEHIVNTLGCRYEIGPAKCGSTLHMFVMDGDYDVVIMDNSNELKQTVINYFKDMI